MQHTRVHFSWNNCGRLAWIIGARPQDQNPEKETTQKTKKPKTKKKPAPH